MVVNIRGCCMYGRQGAACGGLMGPGSGSEPPTEGMEVEIIDGQAGVQVQATSSRYHQGQL